MAPPPSPAPMAEPVAVPPAPPTGARPGNPPAPTPPSPRSGDLRDEGAVVRESVRARSWSLKGWAKVAGAIELDQLSVAGDLAVAGPATIDRCESDGHVTIEGATTGTGPWSVAGEHRFGAAVSVGALTGKGRVDVRGPLSAVEAIDVDGTLDVGGEVRARAVRWRGAARIHGEVRAPEIRITVEGPSSASALRGDRVLVERRGGRLARDPPVLDVLEIEAKEATLTGVAAQYVRADRIVLGPGCRIAQVDGPVVARDPSSIVGPQRRSTNVPKGLTP